MTFPIHDPQAEYKGSDSSSPFAATGFGLTSFCLVALKCSHMDLLFSSQ